jgi:hypothetical protein
MSKRGVGERNWGDWGETHPMPHTIQSPTKTKSRSRFIIRNMGEGNYEVTNPTGYWWHIITEADGELSINQTDCFLATLNAYALRAVTKLHS